MKTDPRAKGGMLHVSKYFDGVLTLQQLVASIAPSVAVSIEVNENGTSSPAVGSGDWLKLSDDALLSRLDPFAKGAVDKERRVGHHAAIRTISGDEGNPLGRAYIKPSGYFGQDGGWVTVGGLRAARLSNVQGLLVGETLTAARNSAFPTVPKDRLAEWATEQARIIAASKADESVKANCAEIVLECGGELEGLPIVCWGGDAWLSAHELRDRLARSDELMVCFDGEFTYDEDEDDVHPREFKNEFVIGENIITVPQHDGSVLKVGRQSWPRSIIDRPKTRESNLAGEVVRHLTDVWSEQFEEDSENREVGSVGGTSIKRSVTIFGISR
ncbi:hypothetical protein [Paraburkholderia sp.]|uniref:hypothetical protein n=1 Tax=Paraburkholderia sp. TaxID=1926495 RepID=UPI0039E5E2BA